MGKLKNKKTKHASDVVESPVLDEADRRPTEQVRAIDGHNTQGWSNSEIKAYNELVQERQKLEKQRHELEEKCAKSQTQRALLHENVANIDSLFKQQKSMSPAYKFTGQSDCCVEIDADGACGHEVCKRAKTQGVSDLELDTIKYYSLRIHAEKSDRMRNALRKQRDLELIRIKKEEGDGPAQNAKKGSKKSKPAHADNRNVLSKDMSKAAKETERIVNKIIHQLDDLRSDLQTGRISAEEAQSKLNILDTKLPAIQDKSNKNLSLLNGSEMNAEDIRETTAVFQDHLRDRLLSAQGDTFSQAFSIMDHFLSATKPDDLQAAISELKEVLQLSGPMCDDLQHSFGALEGIFDNPDKLSFSGPDGKQECTSMIDLMDKLKETLKRTGQLPEGANASLTKTFQDCIDLESEAKSKMILKCNDMNTGSNDMPAALLQIKNDFVTKSPIPPLTSNKLAIDVTNLLDDYDVRQLLAKASTESKPNVLEAHITSLVISRTHKKPEKFVEKLQKFDFACRSAEDQKGSIILGEAIANVMAKMKKWVPAPETKEKHSTLTGQPKGHSGQIPIHSKQVEMAKTPHLSQTDAPPHRAGSKVSSSHEPVSDTREALVATIRKYGKFGLWRTFQMHCHETSFSTHPPLLEKVKSYKEKVRAMIEDQAYGLKAAVGYLFKIKLCPGAVAAIMSQVLIDIAQISEDDCCLYLRELSSCIDGLPHSVNAKWGNTFQHIVLAMIQLYVAVYVESMVLFPELSALCLALTTVETFTNFVLLSKTTEASCDNIHEMVSYLLTCFGRTPSATVPLLEAPFFHYRYFCVSDGFRCPTAGPCSKHMSFTPIPFNIGLGHVSQGVKQARSGRRIPQPHRPNMDAVEEVSQATPTSNVELDPDVHKSSRKIKPMKSVVTYPPGYQTSQQQKQETIQSERRNLQYAECLKKATDLYNKTASRALAIAELRTDNRDTQKILSPSELLAAMDDILIRAGNNHYRPIEGTYVSNFASNNISKFSEHLDESQRLTHTAISGALIIENTFRKMKSGTLGEEYLQSISQSMVNRALSGKYPTPIEAIAIYAESLAGICKIPDGFEDALVKAQTKVENILEDPKSRHAYETRRLRHLLAMAAADEPSALALIDLAIRNSSAFDEYHQIIADRFEETDTEKTELLERSFADVVDLAQSAQLSERSTPMIKFFKLVLEDWGVRHQHMFKDDSTPNGLIELDRKGEGTHNINVDEFAMHYDGSPTIVKSPAKLPTLQTQSLAAMSVATQASISLPYELSESTSSRSFVTHDGRSLEETMNKVLASTSYLEKVAEVNSPSTDIEEPQYLLSNDHVDTEKDGSEDSNGPSTPATFRMLDMTKHLTVMQRNAKDVLDGAGEMMKLSKEHGQLIGQVAQKLAAHVADCASLVAQIGEWNGIEVAQEGFTPAHSKKK